jgi:hypothetical protein
MTAGVSTTAKAKLNSSTRALSRPRNRPVEIVEPERENPRKGRQSPCTAPIHADSRTPSSRGGSAGRCLTEDDHDADHCQAGGDHVSIPEKLFNFGMHRFAQDPALDAQHQREPDDARDCRCHGDPLGKLPKCIGRGKVSVLPRSPEVHNDGQHCPCVEHDEKKRHLRSGRGPSVSPPE